MMVKILLYGYCLGIVSSRRIERATCENLAFGYKEAAAAEAAQQQAPSADAAASPCSGKKPRSGYGPHGVPRIEHLRQKLRTPEGKAIYAQRRETVEPVRGQIQERRGFRRFLLRGLEKVRAEWRIICLTHNLLKLYRSGRAVPAT
jgi:hypothetical protein